MSFMKNALTDQELRASPINVNISGDQTSSNVFLSNGKVSTLPPSYDNDLTEQLSLTRNGLLRIIDEGRPASAFGLPVVTEPTTITQQHFTYGIHPRVTKVFKSSGASVVGSGQTGNGSDAVISIDSTAHAFAITRSFRALHYRPGLGQMVLLTAAFNSGVANSQQFAGAWSPDSGYFVGYDGTTFGCFARTDGIQEIRTLTVTTAATSGGNVTITIDGSAITVSVTNQAGNPSRTAREIASASYNLVGGAGTFGWDAYALGSVVYFISRRARVNSGSFSFAAGTTGSAAAFATVRSGVDEVDNFGSPDNPGSNWVFYDRLDGTGLSGLNLNKQKGIIYGISFGHLGHRGARMLVMNPNTGRMIKFAEFNYIGTSVNNVMNNPTTFVGWGIISKGSTTAMTMHAGSGVGQIEGKIVEDTEGENFGISVSKTGMNGTFVPIIAIKNSPFAGFGGQKIKTSRIQIHLHHLNIGVNGGGAGTFVDLNVLLNPTINNLANFTQIESTTLGGWNWLDTVITSAAVTGGIILTSLRVPTGISVVLPLSIVLDCGDTIAIVINPSSSSNNTDVTIHGKEIQ